MRAIRAVRLGLQFSCRAGKAGWLRLALMCFGAAVGVVAMLQIWVLPQVLSIQSDRATQRAPIIGNYSPDSSFKFSIEKLPFNKRQIERIFIAVRSSNTPVPPGIPRLPQAGEVFISPALSTMVKVHPELQSIVPGRVVGKIASPGLTDPDDLFAYIGLTKQQMPASATPGRGFGIHDYVLAQHELSVIILELLLLIGGPAAIYLVTCARLSATTRTRRFAGLRLVGMGRKEILIVAGTEGAVSGAVGGFIGLALFRWLAVPLANSGAFGFKWYSVDAEIGNKTLLSFHLLVIAIGWFSGIAGTRRAFKRPLWTQCKSEQITHSWLWLLPLLLGIALLFPIVWRFASGHRFNHSALLNTVVFSGGTIAIIGALLALRPLIMWIANHLLRSTNQLSIRLAARRLECDSSGSLRIVAGLMLLMFVSGIGITMLRSANVAAAAQRMPRYLSVRADNFAPEMRDKVFDLPAQARIASVYSMRQNEPLNFDEPRITAAFVTCADLTNLVGSLPECRDGHSYRLLNSAAGLDDRPDPTVGQSFAMGTQKQNWELQIPRETLVVPHMDYSPLLGATVLVTSHNTPPGGWPANTDIAFINHRNRHDLLALETGIYALAPTADLQFPDTNMERIDALRVHKGAITLGVYVGFSLGVVAFLVAAIDAAYERRSSITALAVLGIPRRTLQLTQYVQLGLPLMLGLGLSVLVGQLTGAGYLALGGSQDGLYLPALSCTIHLVILTVALAAVAALVVVGNRPRAEQLRRE